MSTLSLFSAGNYSVPGNTSWYLAGLGEFRGKQERYTRQSPQRLKTLREVALSESPISGNRPAGREGRIGQRFELIICEVLMRLIRMRLMMNFKTIE